MKSIKVIWEKNRFGFVLFIIGNILCLAGLTLSLFWKLGLLSFSEKAPYVVAMIGIGVTFILTGINVILQPPKLPKWYAGFYKRYIEENEILIIICILPIILMIIFFMSYPDGWNYPTIYIILVPYAMCIFLLSISIISNIGEKDNEIVYIRKELIDSNNKIREKDYEIVYVRKELIDSNNKIREREEMGRDTSAPDYVVEFAEMLKRNIDGLKSVMDDLKMSIDDGTRNITERTASVANKYRFDNEQLHNDVQKFKQRMEKDKKEFKERANERIIKGLTKSLETIDEIVKFNKNSYLIKEIEGIKQGILNTFKEEGIEIINPSIGEDFDDKKCCAIQTVETDKFPEKKIIDIKKIGYMFKSGKIIKYADVVVSKSIPKNECKTKTDEKIIEDDKNKKDNNQSKKEEVVEDKNKKDNNQSKKEEVVEDKNKKDNNQSKKEEVVEDKNSNKIQN